MRSTQLTEAITWIEETTDITVTSPQIRRRKCKTFLDWKKMPPAAAPVP
jgi:hypothetical protein